MAQTDPQREVHKGCLEVPGARLYYETYGSGPVMLMVPGATGSAYSFQRVREHLAARYTVATYDRRGFSRSQLDGQQDYDRRLETDANDVRRLIEHSSDKPAILFGSSSGGIIVLEVLARHPSVVRTLVPHEPTAVRSEEHTSELQSLMRISYAVFCLKKKKKTNSITSQDIHVNITTLSTRLITETHTHTTITK